MTVNLGQLGKIAGIGGIAIGAAVLILRPMIEGALPGLEPAARAQAVLVIAIGAFFLGIAGIVAWRMGSRTGGSSQRVTAGRDAAVGERDAIVGSTVSRIEEGAGKGVGSRLGKGEQAHRNQRVEGSRDAAVGGRDAIVNSKIGGAPDADQRGRR